mmetsp:Transcript_4045/g.15615  ORF Transcript_4045/g.15615 Transcript_4045/m.15615 type:complete len:94 (-) Transcript_4045:54-335(-)
MRLGPQCYVNAEDSAILARYINDCRNALLYNVRFDKRADLQLAHVIAIRPIRRGHELYASYGRFYWIGKTPTKLRLADVVKLEEEDEKEEQAT